MFQYSENVLESYCPSASVYVKYLKRKQLYNTTQMCRTGYMFLRGVHLLYFNMKKPSAENYRIF